MKYCGRREWLLLGFCAAVSFLSLIPFGIGLYSSTKMSNVWWKDSAKYFAQQTNTGRLLTRRDWVCVTETFSDTTLNLIKQFNLPQPNTTTERLIVTTTSFYAHTGALFFMAAVSLQCGWLFMTLMAPSYLKWFKRSRINNNNQEEEEEAEPGRSNRTCLQTSTSVAGGLTTAILFLCLQYSVYYLQETLMTLINFTQMKPDPIDSSCMIRGRNNWPWRGEPANTFTAKTNEACLAAKCLLPPYINADWWWMGLLLIGLPIFWLFVTAVMYFLECCHSYPEGKTEQEEHIEYSLLGISYFIPISFVAVGLVMAWRTQDVMQPLIDVTWSLSLFWSSSKDYRNQKVSTTATMCAALLWVVFQTIQDHCCVSQFHKQNIKNRQNQNHTPSSPLLSKV